MITLSNYYDPESRYLTRSKMMDYLKSPALFKQYWIDHNRPDKERSAAFKVGGAVDNLLAQLSNIDNYAVFEGDARTKEGKEYKQALLDAGKEILTRAQYDEIINLADAVTKTSAYKKIMSWEKQKVLFTDDKIGDYFDGLAGLPDYFKYDEETGIIDIVDLKTSRTIGLSKYFYHCVEYGYLMQAALYSYLARVMYPNAIEVRFWHLVVEKSDANNVELFRFDNALIENEIIKLKRLIQIITEDKEFKKKDASFNDPQIIVDTRYEFIQSSEGTDSEEPS